MKHVSALALAAVVLSACSGDAPPPLMRITEIGAGSDCPKGGQQIELGQDINGNGSLDTGEVTSTNFICEDARGYLTVVTDEPAGANCASGGVRIEVANDEDGSGTVDFGESLGVSYACNGTGGGGGGLAWITKVTDEPAGTNCSDGGARIDAGADVDQSTTLESSEIGSTAYVCDGADGTGTGTGTNGHNGLIKTSAESAGANCTNGGIRVDSGLDANDDNVLSGNEVDDTRYVCNGANGTGGGGGGSLAVTNFVEAGIDLNSIDTNVTALTASITVPGPGVILVTGTGDGFCATTGSGSGHDCGATLSSLYFRVTDSATAAADLGSFDYVWLSPNITSSISRTMVKTVSAAGTYDFYIRVKATNGPSSIWRRQLDLVYIP